MRFKIDENLPVEVADLLRTDNHDAQTIWDQKLSGEADRVISDVCLREERILVALDLDFADIRTYPPRVYPGLIVLRLKHQDKPHVIQAFRSVLGLLKHEPVEHRLWIVEEKRVRMRGE